MPPIAAQLPPGEAVLDFSAGAGGATNREAGFQARASDPVVSNVATPSDYAAQFPTLLDPTEILAMCDEITVWQAIPEIPTGLKVEQWREMTSLEFTSGSHYVGFADGACPEEYQHGGENRTITLKNLGAKKSLTISDILDSAAKAGLALGAIGALLGGFPSSSGLPGGSDMATFLREQIVNVKDKEIRLGLTLVLNGYDRVMVVGDATTYPLEFNGIEYLVTTANGAHVNAAEAAASGTFSAISFDRFLSEACAKPQTIFGHPKAIQEVMAAYFQLGFQGSHILNVSSGDRITPGYNFASFVNTAVGRLAVVADTNFTVTDMGNGTFMSELFALRMTHNGEPFVYRTTQIPLAYKDLTPGCTAVSFQIWTKTALVIKAFCAQNRYRAIFTGRMQTTCPTIG